MQVITTIWRGICMLGLVAAGSNVVYFALIKWSPMELAIQLIAAVLLIPAVVGRK